MECFNLKRFTILIFVLYHTVLTASAKKMEARIKATIDKSEGIFTRVDTIFQPAWKTIGLEFKIFRRIFGTKEYKPLEKEWGTYHVFDVSATPGIWYEYIIKVRENKKSEPYFLNQNNPVKGFRPPSKTIAATCNFVESFEYKDNIYIDFDFFDALGNMILPDHATYHIQYDTEQEKNWFLPLGKSTLEKVHHELETTQSRLLIKKVAGMKKIRICVRVIQNGGISRLFCHEVNLAKLPKKKPNFSPPSRIESMFKYLYPKGQRSIARAIASTKSLKYNSYQGIENKRNLNRRIC